MVEALSHYTSRNCSSGSFWGRILQHFCDHRGDNSRTMDTLSSRFRVIRLDCERFEKVHTVVETRVVTLGRTASYKSFSSTLDMNTIMNSYTSWLGRLLHFFM
ncbi:hypothetical protein Hanom_Chr16g01484861 [Helianthus anomalus]